MDNVKTWTPWDDNVGESVVVVLEDFCIHQSVFYSLVGTEQAFVNMQVSVHRRRVGARGAADGSKKRVPVGSWILINWHASCLKYL